MAHHPNDEIKVGRNKFDVRKILSKTDLRLRVEGGKVVKVNDETKKEVKQPPPKPR